MRTPELQDLVHLATTGEAHMWGNETIHTVDHTMDAYKGYEAFKYWFNYQGQLWYYFTSIEHLIAFFLGDENQKRAANELCRVEAYDSNRPKELGVDASLMDETDWFATVQDGVLMKQLVLMENKEFYFNPTTGDTYRVEGTSLLFDEPVHVNDIEVDDWFDLLSREDFKLIDDYYWKEAGYTLSTIIAIRSWDFDDKFALIPPEKIVEAFLKQLDIDLYALDLRDGSDKLLITIEEVFELLTDSNWAYGQDLSVQG